MDEEDERGASRTPEEHAHIAREVRTMLEELEDRFAMVRLELAWTVSQALLRHVGDTQPMDVYLEYCAKSAAIHSQQAVLIKKVIAEDGEKESVH